MDINKFIESGFTHTIDKDIESLIGTLPKLENWQLDSSGVRYPENIDLSLAHEYISRKYVAPFFSKVEMGYRSIWEGSDIPTTKWHNDLIEGSNLFFMYYLTDVFNEGEICFRCNNIETGKLQPKKYMLLMGSQELFVEHKVNLTTDTRIACNFGFNVKWI